MCLVLDGLVVAGAAAVVAGAAAVVAGGAGDDRGERRLLVRAGDDRGRASSVHGLVGRPAKLQHGRWETAIQVAGVRRAMGTRRCMGWVKRTGLGQLDTTAAQVAPQDECDERLWTNPANGGTLVGRARQRAHDAGMGQACAP